MVGGGEDGGDGGGGGVGGTFFTYTIKRICLIAWWLEMEEKQIMHCRIPVFN
jgi:hypothetical protein